MPKVKNEKQTISSSTSLYNIGNHVIRRESLDEPQRGDLRRLSAIDRRNSVETSSLMRKSALKRTINENPTSISSDFRRQSFDGGSCLPPAVTRYTQSIAGDTRKGSLSNGKADKQFSYRHGTIVNNNNIPDRAVDAKFNRQLSAGGDYFDTNAKLRTLEDKMRRHKMDVLEFVTEEQNVRSKNLLNEYATKKGGTKHTNVVGLGDGAARRASNYLGGYKDDGPVRGPVKGSMKFELSYPDYAKTAAARNSNSAFNSSYGVISATDLFKLRSMSESIS